MDKTNVELAALVSRVALGIVMLAHGLAKALLFTLPGTAAFFESVGFPGWSAYPVAAIEIVGGALLVVGLWTRWAALVMVPVLLGATTVHLGNGWMFTALNGGWEYPLYLAAVAFAQFLLGTDGALSISALRSPARRVPADGPEPAAV